MKAETLLDTLRRSQRWRIHATSIAGMLVVVIPVASYQMWRFHGGFEPTFYIVPVLAATLVGVLIARIRLLKAQVEAQRRLFESAVEVAGVMTWIQDPQGNLVYVNPAVADLLGVSAQQLLGRPERLKQVFAPDSLPLFQRVLEQVRDGADPASLELQVRDVAGRERTVRLVLEPLSGADGTPLGLLGQMEDVDLQQREMRALRSKLWQDPATSLGNVRLLQRDMQFLTSQQSLHHVLVIIHLSGYRHLVRLYGRGVGDRLVEKLAQRIQQRLGGLARLYRLDANRVALLLEDCDEQQVQPWLQLLEELVEVPVDLDEIRLKVRMRAGVALFPQDAEDSDAWLNCAEMAMDNARSTRQRWVWYRPLLRQRRLERQQLEQALTSAVTEGRVRVWAQPVARLDPLRPVGFEITPYWSRQAGTWKPLTSQMHRLARLGLLPVLIQQMLDQAFAVMARLEQQGCTLNLGLNLQPGELLDQRLLPVLHARLEAHGMKPGRLVLEVDETGLLLNADRLRHVVYRMREQGFSLCIDHFGSETASVTLLLDLPVNVVKLDHALFCHDDAAHREMLVTLIRVCKQRGMDMLLDGVHDGEDLQRAHELGADFIQGNLLHEPMPLELFADWVMRHRVRQDAQGAGIEPSRQGSGERLQ